jgi:hypothetical protein
VFDLDGAQRLTYWKKLRDKIETSDEPVRDVLDLWIKAPFVNRYLDPFDPNSWPDPWHLIIDGKYDDLAICLGMLYTLKLTQRFYDVPCEIHMSIPDDNSNTDFYLIIDNQQVLNYEYGKISSIEVLENVKTSTLWNVKTL